MCRLVPLKAKFQWKPTDKMFNVNLDKLKTGLFDFLIYTLYFKPFFI